jgi:CO/xanthine dehydrogenase FAD-binding subunit
MSFALKAPTSAAEALRLMQPRAGSRVAAMAGGTDLLNDIDDGRLQPDVVVSLRSLPWATIHWSPTRLVIGATLPLRTLETDEKLRKRLPGLWQSVRAVGGVALRHRATLGGNLGRASPASDLIPILLALEATVQLASAKETRELPAAEFVRGSRQTALRSGELIQSVSLPSAAPSEYVWQRVRPANDISQVGVAVVRGSKTPYWRIALGGGWPAPQRLPSAEGLLTGRVPTEVEVELAAQEAARASPFLTDKRATESYRRRLVTTLVRRAIRSVLAQPVPAKVKESA